MGSSTASETTINTSTESANTIVTTMTATDGDYTEDSFETSDAPPDYLSESMGSDSSVRQHQVLQPVPVTPKTPQTAKQQTPPTAKEIEPKFVFDVQNSPKTARAIKEEKFVFDAIKNEAEVKTVDRLMDEQIEALKSDARRRNSYKAAQNDFDKIEVRILCF